MALHDAQSPVPAPSSGHRSSRKLLFHPERVARKRLAASRAHDEGIHRLLRNALRGPRVAVVAQEPRSVRTPTLALPIRDPLAWFAEDRRRDDVARLLTPVSV